MRTSAGNLTDRCLESIQAYEVNLPKSFQPEYYSSMRTCFECGGFLQDWESDYCGACWRAILKEGGLEE
jgi:hypothetical protein